MLGLAGHATHFVVLPMLGGAFLLLHTSRIDVAAGVSSLVNHFLASGS